LQKNPNPKDVPVQSKHPTYRDSDIENTMMAVKKAQAAMSSSFSQLASHQADMTSNARYARADERAAKLASLKNAQDGEHALEQVANKVAHVKQIDDQHAQEQKLESEQVIMKLAAQKQKAEEDAQTKQQAAHIAEESIARRAQRSVQRLVRQQKRQKKQSEKALRQMQIHATEEAEQQKAATKQIVSEVQKMADSKVREAEKQAQKQVSQARREASNAMAQKSKETTIKDQQVIAGVPADVATTSGTQEGAKSAVLEWHDANTKAQALANEKAKQSDIALSRAKEASVKSVQKVQIIANATVERASALSKHAHEAVARTVQATKHSQSVVGTFKRNSTVLVDYLNFD